MARTSDWVRFGYLPKSLKLDGGQIRVEPLPTFEAAVDKVNRSGLVADDWVYPPRLAWTEHNVRREGPMLVARYELPVTHQIQHRNSASMSRVRFLISVTGFLMGLRLLAEGDGHLRRTPLRPSLSTDFLVTPFELETALAAGDRFWINSDVGRRRAMTAAINAYQLAVTYEHDFEKLTFLYMAFDAAFDLHSGSIAGGQKLGHWEKPRAMAHFLRIPVPRWARRWPGKKSRSALSEARNALTHDALFASQPMGYAIPDRDLLTDLEGLVSRALIAGLGIDASYTRTPVGSRQIIGLND